MKLSFRDNPVKLKISAPPSKSIYHRELIESVLALMVADRPVPETLLTIAEEDSNDIAATKKCLRALAEGSADMYCGESGSTLRFMISVCAAVSGKAVFHPEGRLFERPLEDLSDCLSSHGISILRNEEKRTVEVSGKLTGGDFVISGNVSSQYITGLLMILPFYEGSRIVVKDGLKSAKYIDLTVESLRNHGVEVIREEADGDIVFASEGRYEVTSEGCPEVEGDWSNGAFLLCLGALSRGGFTETGMLNPASRQGDIAILDYLQKIGVAPDMGTDGRWASFKVSDCVTGRGEFGKLPVVSIDCADIPDIAPYMAITSAFLAQKTLLKNIGRLRIKESDRVMATISILDKIGAKTIETENELVIDGLTDDELTFLWEKSFDVSSFNDHRMAMCAILAAAGSGADFNVDNFECVNKSFPQLVEIFGGNS